MRNRISFWFYKKGENKKQINPEALMQTLAVLGNRNSATQLGVDTGSIVQTEKDMALAAVRNKGTNSFIKK